MSQFNEIHTFPAFCRICLAENNLSELNEDNNLFNVLALIIKLKGKTEDRLSIKICSACIQRLCEFSHFIDLIKEKWAQIDNISSEGVYCTACLGIHDLTLIPQSLLLVFQDIIGITFNLENQLMHSCNKCLKQLQDILRVINKYKENYEYFTKSAIIKQEACIKEEPIDDEFVETPKDMTVKTEPKEFSYDTWFETNNNYPMKTESKIEDIDCNYKEQKSILKLEIEREGIDYDCKQDISISCPFCSTCFGTTRALINHMKQKFHCRKNRFTVQDWKKILEKISKPFRCQVCLKFFSTIKKKKQHINNHFRRSCVPCHSCGKLFTKRNEYLKHFRFHLAKQRPLECKKCPKQFSSKLIYMKHLQIHKKRTTKRYKCDNCSVSFSKRSHYNLHRRKMVPCPHCPRIACRKSYLKVHLRTHTGERPFECAVCSHRFSHKGNLIKHSRIHTGFKPFSCSVCLKKFSRIDYLTKHSLTMHSSIYKGKYHSKRKTIRDTPKKYTEEVECDICQRKLPSKQSLGAHMRIHNSDKNFQCEICSKTFTYKGLLNGHRKIHLDHKPYSCDICSKRFIKRSDLTRHTFTHTKEKNHKCEICFDRFSRKDVLRLHLRSHTGQRPYECANCLKSFVQKSNLTHHLKKCNKFFEVAVD